MHRILLTGATGIIGSAVVRIAIQEGYDITCIVRRGSSRLNNLPQDNNVHIIECNIDEYKSLELADKYDAFIHLAWDKTFGSLRDDVDIQMRNIQYTLDAVRLAKKCGCTVFVGAGSQAEYGRKDEPLTVKTSVSPESGYGIAKFAAGKLSSMLCDQIGIRFCWIRIVSAYGISDAPYTLISYVINELKSKRIPELTKCEQIWDYLYSDDVARGFLAAMRKGVNGKAYPIGSGRARRLSDYVEDIRDMIDKEQQLGFGKKAYYPHQPMFLIADISELTQDTGWEPRIGFKDGINTILNVEHNGLAVDRL